MPKVKDPIWNKFGAVFVVGDSKSGYAKCLACQDPVIAAAGCMRDHWAKCKRRLQSIGQLEAGFTPSRKSAKSLSGRSAALADSFSTASGVSSVPVVPMNSTELF